MVMGVCGSNAQITASPLANACTNRSDGCSSPADPEDGSRPVCATSPLPMLASLELLIEFNVPMDAGILALSLSGIVLRAQNTQPAHHPSHRTRGQAGCAES